MAVFWLSWGFAWHKMVRQARFLIVMNVNEFDDLPTVQCFAIKHDFGKGRYVTLMVTKFPQPLVGFCHFGKLQDVRVS